MKTFFKKIIAFFVMICLVGSTSLFLQPKKAEAFTFIDPVNLIQNALQSVTAAGGAASTYSLNFKEYVLDNLATLFAKQIIRHLTNSIVNWINTGFEGSPSFLQNPGAFFTDVADQITGDFIAKNAGLEKLCSPFSLDIRLALAFKYRPRIQTRYTCTLSKIISNTQNAVKNSSINGFTAGDFKQGGWPAFISMTTVPQNNVYGAYLQADAELGWRVLGAQAQQKEEISAGKGFLSWRDPKCIAANRKHNEDIKAGRDTVKVGEGGSEYSSFKPLKNKLDCPVQTPGSVIQNTLQNNLNGPLRELELADELNEIVNALFAQLASQVLQKGLGAVSSKGSSGKSYLDQTIQEFEQQNAGQNDVARQEVEKGLVGKKKDALEYQRLRKEALDLVMAIKNDYDAAKACYNAIITSAGTNVGAAQNEIAEIDSLVNKHIASSVLNLVTLTQQADKVVATIQTIETTLANAKTTADTKKATDEYTKLIDGPERIGPVDIQTAKDDLETLKKDLFDIQRDAARRVQNCKR